MADCVDRRVGAKLSGYELGILTDAELREFELHLIDCDYCFESVQKFRQVTERLRRSNGVRALISQTADSQPGVTEPSPERVTEAPQRTKSWLTVKRVSLVAAAALVITILKPWNLQFQPTHEAKGSERRLAIMPFENLVDHSDTSKLAAIATNLLITDISESHYLQVVSNRTVSDLRSMLTAEGKDSIALADIPASVAKAAGAKWMLTGSVVQVDPHLILTSQLIEVATSLVLTSYRVTADQNNDIFSLVDQLAAKMRNDLLVPLGVDDEYDPSVAEVTTYSAPAYRYYLEGLDYYNKSYLEEARQSWMRALGYDSTFAMCYYYLARGIDRSSITGAVQYSARASRRERLHILSLEAIISGDLETAVSLLQEIVETYPEDVLGWTTLAEIARLQNRNQEALQLLSEAIRISPAHTVAYNSMAYLYLELDDVEMALTTVDAYIAIAPDQPNPYDTKGDILASDGRLEEALFNYNKAYTIKPDFADYTSALKLGQLLKYRQEYQRAAEIFRDAAAKGGSHGRSMARTSLALLPMYYGRLEEGRRILDDALAADRFDQAVPQGHGPGQRNHFAAGLMNLATGDFDLAKEDFALTIEIAHTYDPADSISYRATYAFALAQSGDLVSAEKVIVKLRQHAEASNEDIGVGAYWVAEALLSFTKAEYNDAVKQLEQVSNDYIRRTFNYRFWRARACLGAGRYDDATDFFQKALANYGDTYRSLMPLWDVQAHFYLAEAYEHSGNIEKAVEQYETFVSIWSDADLTLQPMVVDAQGRLARLENRP